MKVSIPTADGNHIVFEGTFEEVTKIGHEFVSLPGRQHQTTVSEPRVPSEPITNETPKTEDSRYWTEESVRNFLGLLRGDQAKLVRYFVERGGKPEYSEIGDHMGYDAQKLSGRLAGITRNSKKATGNNAAWLIDWHFAEGGRREYFMHDDALPLLRRVLQEP